MKACTKNEVKMERLPVKQVHSPWNQASVLWKNALSGFTMRLITGHIPSATSPKYSATLQIGLLVSIPSHKAGRLLNDGDPDR